MHKLWKTTPYLPKITLCIFFLPKKQLHFILILGRQVWYSNIFVWFPGADLNNLVNQAALKAAMEGKDFVSMEHMYFARDKVIMGKNGHYVSVPS